MFTSPTVRTLVYDHTFAFPRLIWYLALICLLFMNYNPRLIIFSTLFLFGMYIVLNYFYYFSTLGYLSEFPEIHKFYRRQWTIIPLMPFFNLMVFFIRFMGIINSIGTTSSWKTANLHEEKDKVKRIFDQDFARVHAVIERVDHFVNTEES
jgi:Na+-transporting methylmalonyl-CoA/oxaloacetate decarboxylase gamma subunit